MLYSTVHCVRPTLVAVAAAGSAMHDRRGCTIVRNQSQTAASLLVIEPDHGRAVTILHRLAPLGISVGHGVISGARRAWSMRPMGRGAPAYRCTVVHDIAALDHLDLRHFDLAICGIDERTEAPLHRFERLAAHRLDLPVIIVSMEVDAPLAREAVGRGAIDFIAMAGDGLFLLPVSIEKCLVHARLRRENETLQRELTESFAELAIKNHQLLALVQQLEEAARTDDLTGLCNRRWLNIMLERAWAEATRNDLPLGFIMIDLDGFKQLNDQLGHQCGDDLLRLAGQVILANCRQVDVAARYGGDEFCILMPHTQGHEVVRVAERILREFTHAVRRRPESDIALGISIGVAHVDLSRPIDAHQLVSHADEAMYGAKAAGKQQVMIRSHRGPAPPMGTFTPHTVTLRM